MTECESCQHENIDTGEYPCDNCKGWRTSGTPLFWMKKIPYTNPKGIDIVMTCGESHHNYTEHPEIATVKVNGKQVYPPTETNEAPMSVKTFYDFAKLFSKITGENWSFADWATMEYWDSEAKNSKYYNNKHLSEYFVIPCAFAEGEGYSRFIKRK